MSEQQIEVVVIHDLTEEVLGELTLAAADLPADFNQDEVTLNIGGTVYQVLQARPATAEKYLSQGRLLLRVDQVAAVEADDILYTIPTLCGEIPETDAERVPAGDESLFVIHEDDWRQIELVSTVHDDAMEEELAAVIEIYEEERVSVGGEEFDAFRKVHVREQLPRPVPAGLTLDALRRALPAAKPYDLVIYEGQDEVVAGAYALDLGPLVLYGYRRHGEIHSAALHVAESTANLDPDLPARLATLMAAHDLILVDWCRVQAIPAEAEELAQYLAQFS